jgi:hypothetical protein
VLPVTGPEPGFQTICRTTQAALASGEAYEQQVPFKTRANTRPSGRDFHISESTKPRPYSPSA